MAFNLLRGVALIVLLMLRRLYLRQTDETETSYLKFCKKLTQGGIVRAVHEGPQDSAVRAAAKQPKNADTIHRISAQQLALRFEKQPNEIGVRALRREVSAFQL